MTDALPRPKRKKKAGDGSQGSNKVLQARASAGLDGEQKDIHDLEYEVGELIKLTADDVSPNPMNRRRKLRNMDELIEDVRANGVDTPVSVIRMKTFVENYPQWAEEIPYPDRPYILGPGHRRHAAAEATGATLPGILRDDLAREHRVEDSLVSENHHRDGLTPIEQALQLDLLRQRGLNTEKIAERSRIAKGTVSKTLSLLDLPERIQEEIHAGNLSAKAGYVLSTIRDNEESNSSEVAHWLQQDARKIMKDEGISAEAAKNRQRQAAAAFPAGNIPPEGEAAASEEHPAPAAADEEGDRADSLPEQRQTEQTPRDDTPSTDEKKPTSKPATAKTDDSTTSRSETHEAPEPEPWEVAAAARDRACRLLLAEERYAKADDFSRHLVSAVLNPAEWKQAAARAHEWLRSVGKGPKSPRANAYFTEVAQSGNLNVQRRAAFAIALAANELRAATPEREWDERDVAHVQFLTTSQAAYQLTAWEAERLNQAAPSVA